MNSRLNKIYARKGRFEKIRRFGRSNSGQTMTRINPVDNINQSNETKVSKYACTIICVASVLLVIVFFWQVISYETPTKTNLDNSNQISTLTIPFTRFHETLKQASHIDNNHIENINSNSDNTKKNYKNSSNNFKFDDTNISINNVSSSANGNTMTSNKINSVSYPKAEKDSTNPSQNTQNQRDTNIGNDNDNENVLPNIVFIMTDDQGWDDVSYHNKYDPNCNNSVQTPNIDAMIDSIGGIELNHYYAQSVCTPSRSALMTGKYPIHNGLERLLSYSSEKGLPLNQTTIAQMIKKYSSNYDTYIVGKWHLGYHKWAYTPTYRGFDQFYGYYCGSQDYLTHYVAGLFDFREDYRCDLYHDRMNPSANENCSRVVEEAKGIYSNFLYNDYILNKILPKYQNVKNSKNNYNQKSNPFFLYFAMQSVHAPSEAPEKYIDMNKHIPTINDSAITETNVFNIDRRLYAGMISIMDETIGNITKALKNLNLYDNTIIIYVSDNGAAALSNTETISGRNYPLRGGKREVFEGGTRVVGAMHIPSMFYNYNYSSGKNDTKSVNKNISSYTINKHVIYDNMMHITDWFPTILDALGLDVDLILNETGINVDGVSHWKQLLNSIHYRYELKSNPDKMYNLNPPRNVIYYGHNNEILRSAIRWNNYKLISWFGYAHNVKEQGEEYLKTVQKPTWNLATAVHPQYEDNDTFIGYIDKDTHIPYSLYDLANDESERYDISRDMMNITLKLMEMLNQTESTAVVEAENVFCFYSPASYVMNARGPWCK